jgi:hypothetical protein
MEQSKTTNKAVDPQSVLTPDQDAADRAVLVAMGCSRDPDDCNMAWYREQYARKLAG